MSRAQAAIKPALKVKIPDISPVERAVEALAVLCVLQDRVSRAQAAVKPVPEIEIPSLKAVEELVERTSRLQGLLHLRDKQAAAVAMHRDEQELLEKQDTELAEEYGQFRVEHPNCPLCGSGLAEVGLESL